MMNEDDFQLHSLHTLVFRSLKKSHDMYLKCYDVLPEISDNNKQFLMRVKSKSMFGDIAEKTHPYKSKGAPNARKTEMRNLRPSLQDEEMNEKMDYYASKALIPTITPQPSEPKGASIVNTRPQRSSLVPTPKWHPPWKLYRVLAGHLGWVRSIAVEPGNEWFATGAADRIIKVWDLASGRLKVSLTGHVSTVRGIAVSHRHPYLFSCGEDRQVKCWDLEYNKVIRHYHGHLSAVHTLTLHPSIDVLITAGRDATARVWDMRTKANVHILTGHTNTISSVISQSAEPQVITGSHDSTVRLWDISSGKTMATLTHHKKAIRSVVFHPTLYMFASASPDNIKQWKCPTGKYVQNLSGHNSIVNALAVNEDGVLVSGGDNGSLYFWDWKTGYNFQNLMTPVQPGSMDNESGIFGLAFDLSGSRLITAEADKTVKIYKEDETATEDTHPIRWTPQFMSKRKF